MTWDPRLFDRSPMLWPLSASVNALRACASFPRRSVLEVMIASARITNARGIPLRLVSPAATNRYEPAIYERGEVQVREGEWHDLFNVLVWLAYPKSKAALNARHVGALRETASRETAARSVTGNRGRVQDALTVFDESGAIFATSDEALIEDLRAFRWKSLFWTRRSRVRESARICVFGHAIHEKALNPYVGMTAHALPLLVTADLLREPEERQLQRIDGLAAAIIADPQKLTTPRDLSPLPLLGVPGWWPDNEQESFYDNTAYFRPGRQDSGRGGL